MPLTVLDELKFEIPAGISLENHSTIFLPASTFAGDGVEAAPFPTLYSHIKQLTFNPVPQRELEKLSELLSNLK